MKNVRSELVSIVLTTLNCARYLRQSIDSCLAQTYTNIELIIVDGGSIDGTLEIIAEYCDPRVRLIRQRKNEGKLPGAINLGLSDAKGEYLTWMQGDCAYHPRAIETMVECLEVHPQIGQVYSDFLRVDEDGKIQETVKLREPEDFLKEAGDPAGVSFLIRRIVREVVGLHDITAFPNHDYDFRIRTALRFRSFHIHEPLYSWRFHTESLTGAIPWPIVARGDIPIRIRHGLITPQQAKRELAEIDMAYAFERFQKGITEEVPALVWSALRRSPVFGLNRGVWSILLKSMVQNILLPVKDSADAKS